MILSTFGRPKGRQGLAELVAGAGFLSSPLTVSETLLLQILFGVCASVVRALVSVCVCASVRIRLGHNMYIYAWISK